ncbi:hypothetical protein PMZ80_003111 [Knufia obscura]|uniref:Uncharacterized protein n=2 Tax=Knufia TaxID=430999 RepID=A0AAN8E8Z1_9EURO|nr:hypothetical protein PMZ80_003111 [Knufia obscura]KAK5949349.1 hypothetical protein OHC33_009702 [Knufia fluminis]
MAHTALKTLILLSTAVAVLAQLPASVQDQNSITLDDGRTVRFKESNLCETTEGVKSYAGYVDIADDKHIFFWFFESRNDPTNDPITLWLNGGPGADSMGGLFDEIGPCKINEDYATTELNPNSWNNVSNLLFLSQPVGVGFSYGSKLDIELPIDETGTITAPARISVADYASVNSTEIAGDDAWNVMKMFYAALPEMAPEVKSKTFHMATQSYGGHWGPTFFNRFRKETQAMEDNAPFQVGALMIVNGLTDFRLQYPSFPKFAMHNTHGVHVNGIISAYMEFSLIMESYGCLALVDVCEQLWDLTNGTTIYGANRCQAAAEVCRNTVEMPFLAYTKRHNYDVRNSTVEPGEYHLPDARYTPYLNIPEVQQALGVDLNYTRGTNSEYLGSFGYTGDFVNPKLLKDLEELLDSQVRVSLWYGDADWVCNWFGGEMLALGTNYTNAEEFGAAGYAPLMVDNTHYGDTREFGNFAFTRIFDAGHAMPFYQPEAAFAMFNRVINGKDTATGEHDLIHDYTTIGPSESTYSQMKGKPKRSLQGSAKFRNRL